jgi:hypothetical protein
MAEYQIAVEMPYLGGGDYTDIRWVSVLVKTGDDPRDLARITAEAAARALYQTYAEPPNYGPANRVTVTTSRGFTETVLDLGPRPEQQDT